jgi:tripartite-type tricarboxylate transporter receptor subunit TctC
MSFMSVARAIAIALCVVASPISIGQAWPARPVRIVAVFPPGGSVDQVARVLAQQLSSQLGQTFVVDNKGGASGAIGTAEVARAAPDGYTFAVVFDTHAVNPSLIPNLPFDTTKDLAPVMLIGTSPMAIVAHASQPYKDFRDVIAAAKAKPGSVAYGSIGTGSLGHLAMAQIASQLGVELTHVPYKGGGPLMNDAIAGQVPLAIGTVFLVTPHVKSGRVKPLAVTSGTVDAQLPGVQPLAAQGVPGFEALAWWGVFAPAATPRPIVQRMHDELAKALHVPAVADKLTGQGMTLRGGTPSELQSFVTGEIARWGRVVKDNNIKSGD